MKKYEIHKFDDRTEYHCNSFTVIVDKIETISNYIDVTLIGNIDAHNCIDFYNILLPVIIPFVPGYERKYILMNLLHRNKIKSGFYGAGLAVVCGFNKRLRDISGAVIIKDETYSIENDSIYWPLFSIINDKNILPELIKSLENVSSTENGEIVLCPVCNQSHILIQNELICQCKSSKIRLMEPGVIKIAQSTSGDILPI
jgi:hypothetical protein